MRRENYTSTEIAKNVLKDDLFKFLGLTQTIDSQYDYLISAMGKTSGLN